MCQHYGIDLIKKKFGIKRNLTENPKKNLPLFLERISMLLEAGLPIDIAFRSMSRNNSNDYFSNMATSTSERLGEGEILSVILEEENIVFDPFDIAVIKASEETGDLFNGFSQLLEHHKKRQALNQKLKSTFTYPAILTVAAVVAIIMLLTVVVPKFESLIHQNNINPPLITSIMLSSSEIIRDYGWVAILLISMLVFYCKLPNGRKLFQYWLIRAPWLGNIIESLAVECWARGMALLLNRGIPLPQALVLCSNLYGNFEMREAATRFTQQIKEGRKLTTLMAEAGYFPDATIQLVSIGEETGELDKMLEKSADYLAMDTYSKLGSVISILEPLIILILGGIIALVVIALMTTTMGLNLMVV